MKKSLPACCLLVGDQVEKRSDRVIIADKKAAEGRDIALLMLTHHKITKPE